MMHATPPCGPLSNADILAAQMGDHASWTKIYCYYGPIVLRWCRFLGAGLIDHTDATQEVFCCLHRIFNRLHHAKDFESFLYGITRRIVSDRGKRAWLRRWTGGEVPERAAPRASPERAAHLSELSVQIEKILNLLSLEHREVLILCLIEGRTSREVADILDVKETTIRSRLNRARVRFRALALEHDLDLDEER